MKNAVPKGLYIRKLKVYDHNIMDHIYLKKGGKYINIKTDKVANSIDETELKRLLLDGHNLEKVDIQDLKLAANRYVSKANYDPKLQFINSSNAVNQHSQYIYINPFHHSIDEYRYLIQNIGEVEKLRKNLEGECELRGVQAKDSSNRLYNIKVYYNHDSENEPLETFFTRKIKKLQKERKSKKGNFFK